MILPYEPYLHCYSTRCFVFGTTVKLGYNELGYNEHPDITNKLNSFGWFELF